MEFVVGLWKEKKIQENKDRMKKREIEIESEWEWATESEREWVPVSG